MDTVFSLKVFSLMVWKIPYSTCDMGENKRQRHICDTGIFNIGTRQLDVDLHIDLGLDPDLI